MVTRRKSSKTGLYAIISIIIIIILGIGTCFFLTRSTTVEVGSLFEKGIKDETITADNYEEIMDKIEQKMKDDEELYYLSYSVMYYMLKDGMASVLTNPNDESAMYVNIYGKTVKQLIQEGKQLMKDNNITIEQYKQQLEDINAIDE